MQLFANNQKEIERMLGDEYVSKTDVHVIDQDLQNMPMEDRIKMIMQQERQASNQRQTYYEKNANILQKLAETGSETASVFALEQLRKNGALFFEYPLEFCEILKKGNIAKNLRAIFDDISSGEIPKSEHILYAFVLMEMTSGMRDVVDKERVEKLMTDFEKAPSEIFLLTSMLKEAKAAGEKIDYEAVKYLKLYEKPIGEDLPGEEKEEILEMARDTYFNDVYKDNPEAAQRVIDELEGELFGIDGLKNQRTYILKYQGRVIAFCRFKPIKGKLGHLYAGSLNVCKDLRELSIGGYFVRATTGKEAKEFVLEAVTRENNVANESYKKCGWVLDEANPFEKTGVKYFNMEMDRREK